MHQVSRWLLRAVTAAVPVVLSACYGVVTTVNRAGKVIDSTSKAGIADIRVACRLAGVDVASASTGTDGSFLLQLDDTCDTVEVTDVDGAENGGTYAAASVPYVEGSEDLVVELSLQ